ncbi:type I secretion system permease/ATPase [Providencia rettgeri]
MDSNYIQSFILIASYLDIKVDEKEVVYEASNKNRTNQIDNLISLAKDYEFIAKKKKIAIKHIDENLLPVIAIDVNGNPFLVLKKNNEKFLIFNILSMTSQIYQESELSTIYSGELILINHIESILKNQKKFDFSWFIPLIVKYRNIFLEIFILSLFIQLTVLITPLFFQVIMDKVLAHQSFNTLNVIAVAFLIVTVFDVLLNGVRGYLLAHTANRIDAELGFNLLHHIMGLPIRYFEERRVGETIARVKEQENIRQFITGQGVTTLLDIVFSFIFLLVMWMYSPDLTLIILFSIPFYLLVSITISPIIRKQLNTLFEKNAHCQSFLVEIVSTVSMIKSMAAENRILKKWNTLLPNYLFSAFTVAKTSILGQQSIQLIQKIVTIILLWKETYLVIDNQITVGQFIAFNMLSSQIIAPIIRISQLWQDFQQVSISVERLGDILNTPTERNNNDQKLPILQGKIRFSHVSFRYSPNTAKILDEFNLDIIPGEIIGLVGRSGSGKSTLAKLLQRLYTPENGQVYLDDIDISLMNPHWLRRNIGVVQQENTLLNQTIRENISLICPQASLNEVIEASRLAGAHDFIIKMKDGYDTEIGEHGVGLSGGQRQRIALARVLLSRPKILILDEATSALDYESEQMIKQNMKTICLNKTVIIIAHRLSTVRHADRIIVMDEGRIIEQGSHEQLMLIQDGLYRKMSELS